MRWLPVVLATFVLLSPLASAGTEEDPEISDSSDDSGHPDGARDIVKVWLEESETSSGPGFAIHLMIADDYDHTIGAFFFYYESYKVMFRTSAGMPSGMEQAYVDFRPSQDADTAGTAPVPVVDPESLACRMGFAASDDGWAKVSDEIRLEDSGDSEMVSGNHWVCRVGYDHFPGFDPEADEISDLYVVHRSMSRGPLSGAGDVAPDTEIQQWDRAPDEGFGRSFQPGGTAGAQLVMLGNASFPVVWDQSFVNATTAIYQQNWTSPGGNLTGSWNVTAEAGSVAIEIRIGNDTILDVRNATSDGIMLSDVPAGSGVILVNATGFVGNFSLQLAAATSDDGSHEHHDGEEGAQGEGTHDHDAPDANGDTDGHEGNETVDNSDDKESPTIGLVPVAAVLLVAWARRR